MTLATLRLPDVALYGELLHSNAAEQRACCLVAQTLIGASSGAMRLAHRALEMHAVELGYRAEAWVQHAIDGGGDELSGAVADEEGLPAALEQARLATLALTRATAATANEPTLVPGQIADALGHLLVIYECASNRVDDPQVGVGDDHGEAGPRRRSAKLGNAHGQSHALLRTITNR